ncbi:unnamed protein product [Rhodiola kirilowii]
MSQITTSVSELKNDPGRLPSQTIQNPRGNVNTLAVVDVDAALKESAYWVNKMLIIEAGSSKKELGSVTTAPTMDIDSTQTSE